jgi:hypothetical protein
MRNNCFAASPECSLSRSLALSQKLLPESGDMSLPCIEELEIKMEEEKERKKNNS